MEIKYLVRNALTKKPLIRFDSEHDAIEWAAMLNKKNNREVVEVVKEITTVVIEAL